MMAIGIATSMPSMPSMPTAHAQSDNEDDDEINIFVNIYPSTYWIESTCSGLPYTGSPPPVGPHRYHTYSTTGMCHYSVSIFSLDGITSVETRPVIIHSANLTAVTTPTCPTVSAIRILDRDYLDTSKPTSTRSSSATTLPVSCMDNKLTITGLESVIQPTDTEFEFYFSAPAGTTIERGTTKIKLEVEGTNCMLVTASRQCGFFTEPWEALKTVLLADYIGQWFYVIIFLPIPMVIYLQTRNGAYAGFASLGLMLALHELVEQLVFETALSMIAIAAGFLFYEVLRKRLFASGG